MKKLLFLLLVVLSLSFIVACNEDNPDDNSKETLEITETSITLDEGESYTFNVSVNVILNSSNNEVLEVSGKTVTALKEGVAVVTIKLESDEAVSKEVTVTVVKNANVLEGIQTNITLPINGEYTFNVENISVVSNDETKVSVNGKTIKGLQSGTATVTVYDANDNTNFKIVNVKIEGNKLATDVEKWLKETFVTEGADKISLPTTHPTFGGTIEWACESNLVDIKTGNVIPGEYDETVTLEYTISLNGTEAKGSLEYIIIGFCMQDARDLFIKQFKSYKISGDMKIETTFDDCGGTTVVWESSNEEIFSNDGVFNKPYNDSEIVITYTVITKEPATSHTYNKVFLIDGLSVGEKAEPVKEWIDANIGNNGYLNEFSTLPEELVEFNAKLKWEDAGGNKLVVADYAANPIISGAIFAKITITIDGKSITYEKLYKIESSGITDIWDKVELFVDQISSNNFNAAKKVTNSHYFNGYIPFFTQGEMPVITELIEISEKHRPGTIKKSTQYIVVHDTANSNNGANANSQVRYLKNGAEGRTTSWHYTVDQDVCIQTIPDNEVAWHAGDGSRQWGSTYFNEQYQAMSITGGNANGIGIESCVNSDGNYALTERNLAKLVAGLLLKHGLTFDRIKQHNDFSGKNCPALLRGCGLWPRFVYLVQLEYYGLSELKDVTFTWEPVSNNIDEKGLVEKGLTTGTVSFKVTATYKGASNTYSKTVKF